MAKICLYRLWTLCVGSGSNIEETRATRPTHLNLKGESKRILASAGSFSPPVLHIHITGHALL